MYRYAHMHMCVDPDPLFAILIQKATYNTRENFHYKRLRLKLIRNFFHCKQFALYIPYSFVYHDVD